MSTQPTVLPSPTSTQRPKKAHRWKLFAPTARSCLPSRFADVVLQPSFDLVVRQKGDVTRMCDGKQVPVSQQIPPRLKESEIKFQNIYSGGGT